MAAGADYQPPKDKTGQRKMLIMLLWVLTFPRVESGENPHTPYRITWTLSNSYGEVLNQTELIGPISTTFPSLSFDACKGVPSCIWDSLVDKGTIYLCPGHQPDNKMRYSCGGMQYGWCYYWNCATAGSTYWKPSSSWDYIRVKRDPSIDKYKVGSAGKPLPHVLEFTEKGKSHDWNRPCSWGLFVYRKYGDDPWEVITLSRSVQPLAPSAVGPNPVLTRDLPLPPPAPPIPANPVLSNQRPTSPPSSVLVPPAPHNSGDGTQDLQGPAPPIPAGTPDPVIVSGLTEAPPAYPGTGERLLNLVRGAFQALNHSEPDKSKNCWLCLNPSPPYYEGIAVQGNFSVLPANSAAPLVCTSSTHTLTLTQVTLTGTCIGKVPTGFKHCLKNSSPLTLQADVYLVPPYGTYWACNTGLTPCVSLAVLNLTQDFCVLVQLWPRIYWHEDSYVLQHYEETPTPVRFKREPVSITLAILLGAGGIAAGIGTGATALVRSDQFMLLHEAMNQDLIALEESIRTLKDSLTSLSEVVLRNRRVMLYFYYCYKSLRLNTSVCASQDGGFDSIITDWLGFGKPYVQCGAGLHQKPRICYGKCAGQKPEATKS
ncbi:MLV-related proviral Env polyprotein-like [Nannospalax galili]|uniref:MLV-related proviral Env polyprotein-like n=1 Tax=Nannospalax galili TaxID=1026970 RepID=UPI0004ED4FE4|nr:MLV-related proviral Env polyprotein-like [Nannospalax galili]